MSKGGHSILHKWVAGCFVGSCHPEAVTGITNGSLLPVSLSPLDAGCLQAEGPWRDPGGTGELSF